MKLKQIVFYGKNDESQTILKHFTNVTVPYKLFYNFFVVIILARAKLLPYKNFPFSTKKISNS